jgi:WD40 repeat protein
LINAHESGISFLALNNEGTLLATASDKGTLIRIFKTDNGKFLQELRRGKDKAEIYSICFDPSSNFIACSSDKGTIHIWSLATTHKKLKENGEDSNSTNTSNTVEVPKNQKSVFSKVFGGYFDSEWSFAQFRLGDPRCICAFGPNNSIIAISSLGWYYQATFDTKKNGECTLTFKTSLNIGDKESA